MYWSVILKASALEALNSHIYHGQFVYHNSLLILAYIMYTPYKFLHEYVELFVSSLSGMFLMFTHK